MAITIGVLALVVIFVALAVRRRDSGRSGSHGSHWFWAGDGGSGSDFGGGSDGGGGGGGDGGGGC